MLGPCCSGHFLEDGLKATLEFSREKLPKVSPIWERKKCIVLDTYSHNLNIFYRYIIGQEKKSKIKIIEVQGTLNLGVQFIMTFLSLVVLGFGYFF